MEKKNIKKLKWSGEQILWNISAVALTDLSVSISVFVMLHLLLIFKKILLVTAVKPNFTTMEQKHNNPHKFTEEQGGNTGYN